LKTIFSDIALRRNNQKLRDRLIAEGKIRGASPRELTAKQKAKEAELDAALERRGLLNQQGILAGATPGPVAPPNTNF